MFLFDALYWHMLSADSYFGISEFSSPSIVTLWSQLKFLFDTCNSVQKWICLGTQDGQMRYTFFDIVHYIHIDLIC